LQGSSAPQTAHVEEEQAILDALSRTAWNKAKAARLLGMSRRTIYRKIEEHALQEEITKEV
jgi:transcriptional regulator of acetoin/glycerol metabolism